jgi:hypothetical protein
LTGLFECISQITGRAKSHWTTSTTNARLASYEYQIMALSMWLWRSTFAVESTSCSTRTPSIFYTSKDPLTLSSNALSCPSYDSAAFNYSPYHICPYLLFPTILFKGNRYANMLLRCCGSKFAWRKSKISRPS